MGENRIKSSLLNIREILIQNHFFKKCFRRQIRWLHIFFYYTDGSQLWTDKSCDLIKLLIKYYKCLDLYEALEIERWIRQLRPLPIIVFHGKDNEGELLVLWEHIRKLLNSGLRVRKCLPVSEITRWRIERKLGVKLKERGRGVKVPGKINGTCKDL